VTGRAVTKERNGLLSSPRACARLAGRATWWAAIVTGVLLAGMPTRSGEGAISRDPRSGRVSRGAPSLEALVDQMLRALANKDAEALRRLRVSKKEYLDVILRGHVEPGEPPRELSAVWRQYAWDYLNDRSTLHEQRLLADYGGRKLTVRKMEFERGQKSYAGYRAYRQLRLTVADPDGAERELRTGSIAQIGQTYKFISFIRD